MIIRVKRSNGEINEVPFEQYIIGVLAGEMPVSFDWNLHTSIPSGMFPSANKTIAV